MVEVEASPLEQLRCQMKRSKFSFCDADMKASFTNGCADKVTPWAAVDSSHGRLLHDAKRHNKELKNELLREEKAQERLMGAIAEAFAEARNAHEACTRDLEELAFSQRDLSDIGVELAPHAGEGEDLDLCPAWKSGPHSQAAEEAGRGAGELSRVVSQRAAEARKRSDLEAEAVRLQDQLRQRQTQTAIFGKQHGEAHKLVDHLECLREAECQFGLPEIVFDTSQSTVTLHGAHGAGVNVDEALCTLTVEFAQDGALVCAVPHPELGLQREAADSVRRDDLPYLLTMTWRRLCDGSEPARSRRPSRGGA